MASLVKFYSFIEAVFEGLHDFSSDQLEIALCPTANQPAQTNTQLTDLTQIAYTYLSARTITTTSSSQTTGTYKLVLQDLTITCTGGTAAAFQWVVVFNQTSTNDLLIGYYDYGAPVTLNDGEQFQIDFDDTNGFCQAS